MKLGWTAACVALAIGTLLLIGCQAPAALSGSARSLSSPTVGTNSTVLSLVADVTRTTSSQRNPGHTITRSYRIYQYYENGIIYVRIDLPGSSFPDGIARSVETNGVSRITYKTVSGEIESRAGVTHQLHPVSLTGNSIYHRIPLDVVTQSMSKSSFALSTDQVNHRLTATFPQARLASLSSPDRSISFREEYYDLQNSVKTGSKTIFVDGKGNTHTWTESIAYQTYNTQPVPTSITTVDLVQNPNRVDTTGRLLPNIPDPSHSPQVSPAQLAALQADPNTKVMMFSPIVGDPALLDDTITTTETYQNIKVNSINASTFKGAN